MFLAAGDGGGKEFFCRFSQTAIARLQTVTIAARLFNGVDASGIISAVVNERTLNCPMARLKIVNQFDSRFTLEPDAKSTLFALLTHENFRQQVAQQVQCQDVEFTELLFQPVPYTTRAPKGMPPQFEQYHESEEHVIINVPPNFMFKAKIFKPSRLCAIYRKVA